MLTKSLSAASALLLFAAIGCSSNQKATEEEIAQTAVRGQLQGKVKGEVIFTKAPEGPGVKMLVNAQGPKGAGLHAVHIHQNPVCEGNFTSAGPHFNPSNTLHGHPDEREHHVGDLGNIKRDDSGAIVMERTFADLSLDPKSSKYVGNRSVIIHEKADDYSSQPTGGSGARMGCAILQNTAE